MEFRDQEVHTSIVIQAPPEKVWNVLTDFEDYPNWNPFIRRVFGKVSIGSTIVELVYIAPGVFMPLPMEIVVLDHARELAWRGAVPHWFAAISAGEHHFTISPIANHNDSCEFAHHALLRGILMQIGARHIQNDVRFVHEAMNTALKERAEALVIPQTRRSKIV
ncbi:MAG: SRPBCC domain-containing protein [Leptospirales bacterium]|nr:SRPBCC domain-containing protein [Leptospirales bacterium]